MCEWQKQWKKYHFTSNDMQAHVTSRERTFQVTHFYELGISDSYVCAPTSFYWIDCKTPNTKWISHVDSDLALHKCRFSILIIMIPVQTREFTAKLAFVCFHVHCSATETTTDCVSLTLSILHLYVQSPWLIVFVLSIFRLKAYHCT
jgi:hypothetical protein